MKKQAAVSRNPRAAAAAEALTQAAAIGNAGNLAEAERIARDVAAQNPQHAGALQLLGAVLIAQRRPREAIAPLEEAARLNNGNVETETHLAVALRDAGRSDEAVAWLFRAIERQPAFPRAFKELGEMLRVARRYAEAADVLRRGLEAASTTPELPLVMSLLMGGVHLDCADPAGAKVAFARALAIMPGNLDALMGFGVALQYEGDFARAAERFRRVLAADPRHLRARLNLGYCLLEQGQIDDGVACLRAVVEAEPDAFGSALKMLIGSGRGRFWFSRRAAAECLGLKKKL